jgi:acyl-CoA ligase (AMP-forming) (exosortase A-associated)
MLRLVHQLLERAATENPEKEALVHGDRRVSYQEMAACASNLAGNLSACGLKRRDRVAIWLEKSVEEATAFFGISACSGVVVPINTLLVERQVKHILDDCSVRFLVTSAAFLAEHSEMLSAIESLDGILLIDTMADADSKVRQEVMSESPGEAKTYNPSIGEDLAAILYTSGSTGSPKGVMLSHRNILAGSRIVCEYLEISSSERILSVLPFSFDVGMNQLITSVEKGATLVLLRFRFGEEIVREIERERCTGLAGVPTIWAILAGSAPSLKKKKLESMRYFTNTGGPVPSATFRKLRAAQPHVDFFLMYGLTEAFRSTYLPPSEADARPTSIGKAIPECELFLVSEDGKPCGPGEEGILVHRGPTVSLGYWNRPEDTARVLKPHPFIPAEQGGEVVCYSGDRARMDEDGYFYFVGRADAMIKSSGYRISPSEVEEVIVGSGYITESAVIGLPDPSIGERVHAICVAVNDKVVDRDALLEHCARELPRHMLPRDIEFVEALPRTPNGKVDYRGLKAARAVAKDTA